MSKDLIIVIPGIMGSVLTRDGVDLWRPGVGMARRLRHHKRWVASLVNRETDAPDNPGWIDGVIPTELASTTTIVPGLVTVDGYDKLDAELRLAFGDDLIEGDPLEPATRLDRRDGDAYGFPNYYRFAYDWRRDLRASALRLSALIDLALPNLQRHSPGAKVVFIAHSMGGLLARYYIEGTNPATGKPFDGWRRTRELFTMGTPYRGAPVAASHLVEGMKMMFVDFSDALRSFTGIYQLLPRYPAILDTRTAPPRWVLPHQLTDVAGFDPELAREAYDDFHCVIENGVAAHRNEDDYPVLHCVPLIGFGHGTPNSATISPSGFAISDALPAYLDTVFAGGDGTVPLISAIPIEHDEQRATHRHLNQKHGSLPADERALAAEISNRLRQQQAGTLDARGIPDESPVGRPALALDHQHGWLEGEEGSELGVGADGIQAGELRVGLSNAPADAAIRLTISATDRPDPIIELDGVSAGEVVPLPRWVGEYFVEARCRSLQLVANSRYVVVEREVPTAVDDGAAAAVR